MKNIQRTLIWFLLMAGSGLFLAGCTITPGIDVGLDFDYYGGKFHVTPNASVGIHGRP
jgi:hypothetical protein